MIKHIEKNQELFRFWIKRNEKLQHSADVFKPLLEPFQKEFPSVNVNGCPECIIDMLRWALSLIKTKEEKVSTTNVGDEPKPKK
jgi:hypothetical protein